MSARLLTIGHSNHALPRFLALLKGAGVTAVADVRSHPSSRFARQFNRRALADALAAEGIAYVYLGAELGGRPEEPALRRDGKPDYAAMAQTESFARGIARLLDGAARHRIALMCAERDPLDCHRFRLLARALAARGEEVAHILADGTIESQDAAEARANPPDTKDLFGA
jgi:uncharacterized protein (DUF488 family)